MDSETPDVLRQAFLLILTPYCYDKYFIEFNFFDGPCFTSTLSKLLGLSIILVSVLVKLPQIIKIRNNQSGKGISMLSVSLDLVASTINASYSFLRGFPISAWGDAASIAFQTLIIAALVLHYGGSTLKSLLYIIGYSSILFILTSGLTPINVLWTLQGFNIFIIVGGKMIQAYANFKNGNTGQLSAATFIMLFLVALARVFTSIQETGDMMVILIYSASASANGVLVGQFAYYGKTGVVQKKEKKKKLKAN